MLNIEFMYVKVYACELSGRRSLFCLSVFELFSNRATQWTQCNSENKGIPISFIKYILLYFDQIIFATILPMISKLSYTAFQFYRKARWNGDERTTRFKFYPADNIGFKIQHPKNSRKWLYNKAPANLLKIPKSARRSRKGGRKDRNPGCGAYAKQGTGVHGAVA